MKRRALLGMGAALTVGALLEGGPTVKVYEQDIRNLLAAYSWTPAPLLRPQVDAKLAALDAFLPAAQGDALQRLLVVHAELHLLASELARWDLVDHRTAAKHRRQAATSALAANDADLLSQVYARHALVCRVDGNLSAAARMAEEACRLVPRSRAASVSYVEVVAAEALAKVGDTKAAHRRLDRAHEAIARVGPGSRWRGPGTWGPHRMRVYESYALRSLGQHGSAYDLLSAAPEWPADQLKHAVVERRELAHTLYQMGEIEAAAEEAAATYEQARHIQYGNAQEEIRDFFGQLSPHAQLPAVRELGELLRA